MTALAHAQKKSATILCKQTNQPGGALQDDSNFHSCPTLRHRFLRATGSGPVARAALLHPDLLRGRRYLVAEPEIMHREAN